MLEQGVVIPQSYSALPSGRHATVRYGILSAFMKHLTWESAKPCLEGGASHSRPTMAWPDEEEEEEGEEEAQGSRTGTWQFAPPSLSRDGSRSCPLPRAFPGSC